MKIDWLLKLNKIVFYGYRNTQHTHTHVHRMSGFVSPITIEFTREKHIDFIFRNKKNLLYMNHDYDRL